MKRRALTAGFACALALPTAAYAHQPPPPPPSAYGTPRPTSEVTSWVALGGGALSDAAYTTSVALFDLRLGGDVTFGIARKNDLRLGPFVELATPTFAGFTAVGGVELFFGAIPRPLRMFYYSGEGTLLLRFGAGYALRSDALPVASSPVGSVTVAYGYRCPFSLHEPTDAAWVSTERRPAARYMVGVRLYVNATVDLRDGPGWQLTGGLEFEPVGSFRYILGLY